MPEKTIPSKERSILVREQIKSFLEHEALEEIFSLLHTDREWISLDYNARRRENGRVVETQVLEPSKMLEPLRETLYPLFNELGFFHINTPISREHSRLLLFGGAMGHCFRIAKCARQWIDPSTRSVDGLSAYRPINPVERLKSEFSSPSETEFGVLADAMTSVFGLGKGGFHDTFEGDRNLNRISCVREYSVQINGCSFRMFAVPSIEPELRRADTVDSLLFYFEQTGLRETCFLEDSPESLLAITGNRYCNRQFLQLAYCILERELPLDLDVIGYHSDDHLVTVETFDPLQYLQDLISILDWIGRFGL